MYIVYGGLTGERWGCGEGGGPVSQCFPCMGYQEPGVTIVKEGRFFGVRGIRGSEKDIDAEIKD